MTDCTYCHNEIKGKPFEDEGDNPMCSRCWKEYMCFFCSVCRTRKWKGKDDERKQYIIVANEEDPEPGVYRIKDRPFYRSDYFNIWFEEDKLQKVAEINEEELEITNRIVGGYVCFECIKNIHKIEGLQMMNHGNCLWCGRPNVTLMDGRFCGLCGGDLPEPLHPEKKVNAE